MNVELFQLVKKLLIVLEIILYAGCISYFISRIYYKKSQWIRGMAAIFLLYIILNIIKITFDLPSWVVLPGVFFFVALESILRKNGRIEFLIFLFVTWCCQKYLCYFIENSLYIVIINKIAKDVSDPQYIYSGKLFAYSFSVILRVLIIYLMSYCLKKKIDSNIVYMEKKEVASLLLIPVAGVLFGKIISNVLFVVKDNTYFDVYEQFSVFLWMIPCVAAIYYLGILFSISAYSSMMALQEEQKKNFVKEQQIHTLKNRIKEVEQFYDTTRRMKHEMRNHALTIKGLLKKEDYDELDSYIYQIEKGIEQFDFSIKTGNAVTDVIINDIRKKAEQEGIEFRSEFQFEQDFIGIEAFDMGIVISNLLTNGLEACQKQKKKPNKLFISGKQKKKFFLIEVKNTFAGSIVFDDRTGLPISTKEGAGSIHGIGLENVSKAAEKYLGRMDIKIVQNMFYVTVLMQGK